MGKNQEKDQDLSEVKHWADKAAESIISERGEKGQYVCASGISPSGTVHMGNFREIITTELVVRALRDKGRKVRFIYSWDDYDRFRKVPKNVPSQFEGCIGMPLTAIDDPFRCHPSYAGHYEKDFEAQIRRVGVDIEYIYQSEKYQACDYAESIRFVLRNRKDVREIFNRFKKKDLLPEDYLPLSVYCEKCKKDNTKITGYDEEYSISYECTCGHKDTINFRKKGIVKLPWRVDWPMRWDYENVDFESAGKDHFTSGGTRETGELVYKNIWDKTIMGFPYEFIGIKGRGQFASSEGNVLTINETLEIYEPEILRWFFAGTRPNAEFSISFDLDVIKHYEDFDRVERAYFNSEDTKDSPEKDKIKLKRVYELSMVENVPKRLPFQPGFRHLTTLIQTYEHDYNKLMEYFAKELKDEYDEKKLKLRIECAENWLKKYAPEDFKFEVQKSSPEDLSLMPKQKDAVSEVIRILDSDKEFNEESLTAELFEVPKKVGMDGKEFFGIMYKILISRTRGPKLAPFILTIGRERVCALLKQAME